MAHELSHVVMHSLWHPQKHNEIYTDLTALLLGFSEIIQLGRKTMDATQHYSTTTTTTTTYGYLPDESFAYAFYKVQQTLTEKRNLENDLRNQVMQKLRLYQNQIRDFKEKIVELAKFAEYLDKHPNKRIAEKDAQKIVELHRVDRMDILEAVQNKNLAKMEEMTKASVIWLRVTGHYTAQNADRLRDNLRNIEYLIWLLGKDSEKIEGEISLLKKYVGVLGRFEINRQLKNR
jgi:Asp-tRNA(Asn)/Glu-tRNA(Gln) amidotransferase B subunit